MGKFLKSLTDGSLRCKYCGDKECNCLDDGRTKVEITKICAESEWAWLVQFRKQVLINGKKIPSGHEIWIPKKYTYGIDYILKTIVIDNIQINKLVFD